jgi:hypothetical protein
MSTSTVSTDGTLIVDDRRGGGESGTTDVHRPDPELDDLVSAGPRSDAIGYRLPEVVRLLPGVVAGGTR